MDFSLLASIEAHPYAAAVVILLTILIRDGIRHWRGSERAERDDSENTKLVRQTNETATQCAIKTTAFLGRLDEFLEANDLGHVCTKLDESLQMLEKMGGDKGLHKQQLAGLHSLCTDIMSDLKAADSRLVHDRILHKLELVEEHIKRVIRE